MLKHSVFPISVDKLPVLSPLANTSTYLLASTLSAKPTVPFSCIINFPLSTGQFPSAYTHTVISRILKTKQQTFACLLIAYPSLDGHPPPLSLDGISLSTIIPFLSFLLQQNSSRVICANYLKLLFFYSLWNSLWSHFYHNTLPNSSCQDLRGACYWRVHSHVSPDLIPLQNLNPPPWNLLCGTTLLLTVLFLFTDCLLLGLLCLFLSTQLGFPGGSDVYSTVRCQSALELSPWTPALFYLYSTHLVISSFPMTFTLYSHLFEKKRQCTKSCPTLGDPMDCSPPGSSVHGILQARILEWVAISFSRGSSRPRNQTQVSSIAGRFFTNWATQEAPPSLIH